MKKLVLTLQMIILILSFSSCDNKLSNDEVKDFIIKDLNSKERKLEFSTTGTSGAYKIPIKFTFLQVLTNPTEGDKQDILRLSEQKRNLERLQVIGLITMKIVEDKTFKNIMDNFVTAKIYDIGITEKGKEFLVGETAEDYILKTFDFIDIKIIENKKNENDTLLVKYSDRKIAKTPIFEINKEKYNAPLFAELLKSTNEVKFVYDSKNWVIVK